MLNKEGMSKGSILVEENQSLLHEHKKRFEKRVEKVTEGVYSAIGYALGNCILIVTEAGNIIVDTTESVEAAKEIKTEFDKISPLPTAAVIYTHGHTDHVLGTSVFVNEKTEVYSNVKTKEFFNQHLAQLRPIMSIRGARQMGRQVPDEYIPCRGLGPFFKSDSINNPYLIAPTHVFEDSLELTIGGIHFQLVAAPGETDDQIFVWIPDKKVLLSGDNYYPCFPNLYTIRGTTPRPIEQWVQSLDKMRDLGAEYLVPSHAEPIYGSQRVHELLTMYRDAIQYVQDATIRGMNQGKTPDQLAQEIKLPPHLSNYDELLELYGDISQCVRAIYYGHLGWFDGNATNLVPLPRKKRAQKISDLAGGFETMLKEARAALEQKEFQWAAEVSDILLELSPESPEVLQIKADALFQLGLLSQNSNNRGYYLAQSLELKGDIQYPTLSAEAKFSYTEAISIEKFFSNMPILLDPIKSQDKMISACIQLSDSDCVYQIHVRRGVAEIREGIPQNYDLTVTASAKIWKQVVFGIRDVQEAVESKDVQFQGDRDLLRTFIDLFHD